eukprot:4504044-Pyramimonas_sp.AAC.1
MAPPWRGEFARIRGECMDIRGDLVDIRGGFAHLVGPEKGAAGAHHRARVVPMLEVVHRQHLQRVNSPSHGVNSPSQGVDSPLYRVNSPSQGVDS